MNLDHNTRTATDVTIAEIGEAIATLMLFRQKDMVPAKSKEFVSSLCTQYVAKKSLSAKQMYYVFTMIREFMGLPKGEINFDQQAPAPDAGKITACVVNPYRIFRMFKHAQTFLKKPRIKFQIEGLPVMKMYVTADGELLRMVMPSNNGYRIFHCKQNGIVNFAWGLDEKTKDAALHILQEMCKAPMQTVAHYGKMNSSCVFCSLPLSDPKSLKVGYGKICASHYHLPWGAE